MEIIKSQQKITYDKIKAEEKGEVKVANILEIVMDKGFIESSRHDWCWLGSENVPLETGWYYVDRSSRQLLKTTIEKASQLEWHERLYVYGSGHAAVKENSPLALYIGDEYSDGRLSALYLCGPDVLTWVALTAK